MAKFFGWDFAANREQFLWQVALGERAKFVAALFRSSKNEKAATQFGDGANRVVRCFLTLIILWIGNPFDGVGPDEEGRTGEASGLLNKCRCVGPPESLLAGELCCSFLDLDIIGAAVYRR